MRLMRSVRESILEGRFPAFVREYIRGHRFDQEPNAVRGEHGVPTWVVDALEVAGISL